MTSKLNFKKLEVFLQPENVEVVFQLTQCNPTGFEAPLKIGLFASFASLTSFSASSTWNPNFANYDLY